MYVWDILVTQGELIPYKKANTRTKVLICGGLRPTEMLALQLSKYWGCQVSCLSPKYTHESWLSLGADHVLDIEDLRPTGSSALPKAPVGSSKLQFDLVINTGGPLMQDTCNEVATKRVITTLTSAVPTQMKMEYNVIYNCVSSIFNDVIWHPWCVLWGFQPTSNLSRVRIRPEILDAFKSILDDDPDFNYQDIGERVYDAEHIDLAARCLAAGGQHGKLVIRLQPFKKVCPISTHIYCQ
eukprot:02682.XXX_36441_37528_1 [CDS] Oithona nana genome sequencing.